MNMKVSCICVLAAVLAFGSGCCGQRDKSMLLKDWDEVFVPIDPSSMRSLDDALAEKGIGNVMSSDLRVKFVYADSKFADRTGRGIIVYSSEGNVPSGTMFIKARVWQCYEMALADSDSEGIHVNFNVRDMNPYTVSKAEMKSALPGLPKQERLPMDIYLRN